MVKMKTARLIDSLFYGTRIFEKPLPKNVRNTFSDTMAFIGEILKRMSVLKVLLMKTPNLQNCNVSFCHTQKLTSQNLQDLSA